LPWKIDFFCEIAWKNRNFSEIFLENRNFLTRVHDPQISNQIDAAVKMKLLVAIRYQDSNSSSFASTAFTPPYCTGRTALGWQLKLSFLNFGSPIDLCNVSRHHYYIITAVSHELIIVTAATRFQWWYHTTTITAIIIIMFIFASKLCGFLFWARVFDSIFNDVAL